MSEKKLWKKLLKWIADDSTFMAISYWYSVCGIIYSLIWGTLKDFLFFVIMIIFLLLGTCFDKIDKNTDKIIDSEYEVKALEERLSYLESKYNRLE